MTNSNKYINSSYFFVASGKIFLIVKTCRTWICWSQILDILCWFKISRRLEFSKLLAWISLTEYIISKHWNESKSRIFHIVLRNCNWTYLFFYFWFLKIILIWNYLLNFWLWVALNTKLFVLKTWMNYSRFYSLLRRFIIHFHSLSSFFWLWFIFIFGILSNMFHVVIYCCSKL